MAKFQGSVTQEGWSVEFEATEGDNQASTCIVQTLAFSFLQAQTSLQAQGQQFIRESLSAAPSYHIPGEPGLYTNDRTKEVEPSQEALENSRDYARATSKDWSEKEIYDHAVSVQKSWNQQKKNVETLDTREAEELTDCPIS